MMANRWSPAAVLARLHSAYPGGIVPGGDYPALLAVLGRHLPADDVVRIVTELVVRGTHPLTGIDVRDAVAAVPPHADLERVSQCLRRAGWTLTSGPTAT